MPEGATARGILVRICKVHPGSNPVRLSTIRYDKRNDGAKVSAPYGKVYPELQQGGDGVYLQDIM